MREAGKLRNYKEKGDLGEEVVWELCKNLGLPNFLLYHSYKYPYQSNRDNVVYTGNVKYENGRFVEYTSKSIDDEIDVLLVTPYRVFPIEVKSYRAKRIDAYDHWVNKDGDPVDKSPIAQAEKHARHLYHAIHMALPDGDSSYIIPIVCFTDKCALYDERAPQFKDYIPVCIANTLRKTLLQYNKPGNYLLSLSAIQDKLKEHAVSIKRKLTK